jgi:hypothetical protein
MVQFMVELSDDQFENLMERTRQQGFTQPSDYLAALFNDPAEEDEEAVTQEEFLADFRQALLEIERGEGMSIEEFRRQRYTEE